MSQHHEPDQPRPEASKSKNGNRLDPRKLLQEAVAGAEPEPVGSGWQPPGVGEIAERFPELEVIELIGRGGMGAVYRVVQRKLDRTVALKVLPPELAQDPQFEERFLREARALAGLKHERILTVHDFGERDGLYYLVTEFVEGMNLRELMDMGELSPHEALRITPQICEALQFAHDHGVVHRDVKPENLLIDRDGEVRIADFGLARMVGDQVAGPALTRSTQVLGTPQYMAPEQWRDGQNVDHRADIYAVGVVLYEMLTGQLPIGHFDPPSRRQGVPKGLDGVVQRSLAQRPEERFQRAGDVSDELQRHRVAGATARGRASGGSSASNASSFAAGDGRMPGPLKTVWLTAALAFLSFILLAFYMYRVNVEYHEQEQQFETQVRDARRWGSQQTDIAVDEDVHARYYRDVLLAKWQERADAAQAAGQVLQEPRPEFVEEPAHLESIAIAWKVAFGIGLICLMFPICGFSSISQLKRRRQREWLGLAVFTAWGVPVGLVAGGTAGILSENIKDNDLSVISGVVAGVVLGIGGIYWMITQFRRLSQEIAAPGPA